MAILKEAPFKWVPFSNKQKQILTWWCKGISPYADKEVLICDGAVRSGKTVIMSLSFVLWVMDTFNFQRAGMAGKTIGSFRRNVLFTLKIILRLRGYKVKEHRTESYITISKGSVENYFFIFGGKDEASQDLVQGFTSCGFFFDEVALMPESFVNQAVARCSVEGRKLWFNCNPDGPFHWFKLEWVDKIDEKNGWRLRFLLTDNPSLSEATIAFYKRMFKGVFFKRFILGLWVVANGVIYDMFSETDNEYDDGEGPNYDLYHRRYYAIDYGTTNPCVFLEIVEQDSIYYQENERYYDSKVGDGHGARQKDDAEHVDDLIKFIGDKQYRAIVVDPSAASFKITAQRKGLRLKPADNEVLDGIRLTASLFALKRYKINRQKCPKTRQELGSYIWDDKAALRGVEQPKKENDHAMDAVRYFCKTIIKWIKGWK
jgi:PBSX family phage terminase large subunit